MSTYTVQIEGSADGQTWQAVHPAENVSDFDGTAQELADWTATNQTVADGETWRVRVWDGADADTGTEPTAEHHNA